MSTVDRNLKIKQERRKRLQAYTTIDILANLNTFFDFYSHDLIAIFKNARKLSMYMEKSMNQEEKAMLTEDTILLAFLLTKCEFQKTLKEYCVGEEKMFDFFRDFGELKNKKEKKSSISSIFKKKKKNLFNSPFKIDLSDNVNLLIEAAFENALNRFKTPIVTPEIFFITLMEAHDLKSGQLIKKLLSNEPNWYTFRYKLIKNLYIEESHIRENVPKSQIFFAYLLKSKLSQLEFSRLLDLKLLDLAVLCFRNKVVKKALKTNFLKVVEKDIHLSATFHTRDYSTLE